MTDRVRAGIVGVGFMGTVHARAVRRAGGVVSRIVGSSPESSRAGADRIGAEFAAETVEELLAADDVDVVHVCTPNATHAPLVRAAIAAGKHVVCEKPLAVDAAEAAELVALAAAAGVTATVPFVYRFYPTVREARARVADGTAGRCGCCTAPTCRTGWPRTPTTTGGSTPQPAAPHGRSPTSASTGATWSSSSPATGSPGSPPAPSSPSPTRAGRPVSTEDAAVVLFETDRGATGNLTISQISPGRKNRLWFSVDGAAESLCFDQENPESLWIGGREVNRQLLRGTSEGPGAARYTVVPAGHPQGYQDCFDAFVADTYAAIAGEAPDGLPTFADGLRAARITQAVLESSRTSSWVEVA